jgi:hypothetical protein
MYGAVSFTSNLHQRRSCCRPRNIQITAWHQHLVFKKMHIVFSVKMVHMYRDIGEAHLMFVLIKNVHLVDIINGVR